MISLTLDQANFLLRQSVQVNEIPAVFGSGENALQLSLGQRAKMKEGLRNLKKELWDRSFKDDELFYAGPMDLYNRIESTDDEIKKKGLDPIRYEPKDNKKTIDINVTGIMERGIQALILLWMRPDSPGVRVTVNPMLPPVTVVGQLSVEQQDKYAWPLIEQLKLKGWVGKYVGIDSNDDFETFHDDDPKKEDEKVKVKKK